MELLIPYIKKLPLKEYLKHDVNKAAYDFYYQDLKPKYNIKINDFQKFLEETYTLLGIIYFNHSDIPHSVKEYFDTLNEKKIKSENSIITAFQYNIIWFYLVAFNASWDSRPDLVSLDNFIYLTKFFKIAEKEAERITGTEIDFVNEDFDRFYGYFDNDEEFGHISGYKKNLDFLYSLFPRNDKKDQEKPESLQPAPKVKNSLTQTELIELVKALIESKKIKGTQKDIIKNFSDFFSIDIKNPDQILNHIKGRNNGSETLFLDKLKSNLLEHIKK